MGKHIFHINEKMLPMFWHLSRDLAGLICHSANDCQLFTHHRHTLQQLTRKQITEWKDTKIYFLRSTGWICHKYLIPTKISSYTAVYKCETQFDFFFKSWLLHDNSRHKIFQILWRMHYKNIISFQ